MDFEDKKNLFKVRKTVLEMLEDRKYDIPEDKVIDFDEFCLQYKNKILISILKTNRWETSTFIFIMRQKHYQKLN